MITGWDCLISSSCWWMCVSAAPPVLIVFSVSVNIVILVYCIAHMSGNMMRVTAQRLFSQFVLVLGQIEVKQTCTCPPDSSSVWQNAK